MTRSGPADRPAHQVQASGPSPKYASVCMHKALNRLKLSSFASGRLGIAIIGLLLRKPGFLHYGNRYHFKETGNHCQK